MGQYSEEVLWGGYQFAVFNEYCLQGAVSTVNFFKQDTSTVYSVDFSEIFPWIFPNVGQEGGSGKKIQLDSAFVRNRCIKVLWDDLTSRGLYGLPFKLGIGPQTRAEILECLWHQDGTLSSHYARAFPPEVRSGNPDIIYRYIKELRQSKFVRQLKRYIVDRNLSKEINQSVNRLLALLDQKVIFPFENLVPKQAWNEIKQKDLDKSELEPIVETFRRHPGRAITWSPEHVKYHDTLDAMSLIMIRDLSEICLPNYHCYPVFLTHTYRVISAGRRMVQHNSRCEIVHHPGSALYIAKAFRQEGKRKMFAFLRAGLAEVQLLKVEFESHPTIEELSRIPKKERDQRFKAKKLVDVPHHTHTRFVDFACKFYGVIDPRTIIPEMPSPDFETLSSGEDELTVRNILWLIDKCVETRKVIRHSANVVKKRVGDLQSDLSKLYLPQEGHARDLSEWLESE